MALSIDRRRLLALVLATGGEWQANTAAGAAAATVAATSASAAPDPPFLPLWPAGLPEPVPAGLVEEIVDRAPAGAALRDRLAQRVTRPGIALMPAAHPDGSAVLIIPGGGYSHVVYDKEGLETAAWLAARGTTAAVLRYRLPGDGWASGADAPLQDAQRAMRWLRANASMLKIDPARLGVMGGSAGGHLAAMLLTGYDAPVHVAGETGSRISTRPDFGALFYPVIAMGGPYAHSGSRTYLLGKSPSKEQERRYTPSEHVGPSTPPTWLVHASDDEVVPLQNTLDFHAALRAQQVPTELHVYESGGHGFGLRFTVGKPIAAWPFAFRAWAVQHRFMRANT